jgi:hypothetical protein
MENHYVYYSYEEFGRGYIGCRTCKDSPENDDYLGSYYDKTFNPSNKIILETFSTREEALQAEVDLHKFYQVDVNPHFANKARQKTTGFYYSPSPEWTREMTKNRRTYKGENNPFYGKGHSQETKDHLKQKTIETWKNQPHPWIGRKHSEESKIKFRERNAGENNPNYGKTQSEEAKEKVRLSKVGKKWWSNQMEEKFCKECPGEGWKLGRKKRS